MRNECRRLTPGCVVSSGPDPTRNIYIRINVKTRGGAITFLMPFRNRDHRLTLRPSDDITFVAGNELTKMYVEYKLKGGMVQQD